MLLPVLLTAALALAPAAAAAQTAVLTHAQAVQAADEGRNAEALAAFQRLASMNPSDHDARLWIGRLHARMGHSDLAEAVYRSVLLEDPGNADAMVGVAAALLGRHEPSEALGLLETAGQIAPNNDEIPALVGRAHEQAGRPSQALASYQRAVGMAPSVPRRQALEGARMSYLNRIELRGVSEQFDDATPDSRNGDIALNLRLSNTLRVIARGQVQRRFDLTEQRGGGGIEWRWKPSTTLRGQALVGPDNLIMPESDVLGEVEHTFEGVTWIGSVRRFGFSGISMTLISPAVEWMPTDRVSMALRYALSFTDVGSIAGTEAGQSLHVRPAYRIHPRVWLQAAYANGIEDFENVSIDRVGDFRAHTVSGGVRLTLPPLTTIVAGYERQWRRQDDVTLDRVTLSVAQRF